MVYPFEIETESLYLRKPEFSNHLVYNINELNSGDEAEEIFLYTDSEATSNLKESEDLIKGWKSQWKNREQANYLLISKDNMSIVGIGGIETDWDKSKGELGCILRKNSWGNGYSRERAIALSYLGVHLFDLELIEVKYVKENEKASKSVSDYMKEMGGKRVSESKEIVSGKKYTVVTYQLESQALSQKPDVVKNIYLNDKEAEIGEEKYDSILKRF